MPKGKTWSDSEIKIVLQNYGQTRIATWVDQLNHRTCAAVMLKAKSLGLKSNASKMHRIYDIDRNFFDTPNILNSYWAGFIAADGNIRKDKPCVRIKLQASDESHLMRFREDVLYTGPVKDSFNGSLPYKVIEIGGVPEWVSALNRHWNITPAKTYSLQAPGLMTRDCRLAYMKGLIDGDGCIVIEKARLQYRMRIAMIGTKPLMEWFKEQVASLLSKPSQAKLRIPCNSDHVVVYSLAGQQAEDVIIALISLPIPGLDRKWNKYCEFIKGNHEKI